MNKNKKNSSIPHLPPEPLHSIIAIDGPAASGKSSVARVVAQRLGFLFVSSGHFYRALAWLIKEKILDSSSDDRCSLLADLKSHSINGTNHLFFKEQDLTKYLSDPDVNAAVSPLAVMPEVRAFVLKRLHALANYNDLVVEGRDIGSVVFPDTRWKFYLDASPEERARRRSKEGTVDAIAERDQRDSTRTIAPLIIPEGAIVIDTTHLGVEEVVAKILEIVK